MFSNKIPFKANISSSPVSADVIMLDERIRQWINHYYGRYIEFNNHLLPISLTLEYGVCSDNNLISVVISDGQKEKIETTIDISDSYFAHPVFDSTDRHPSLKKILLCISNLLWKLDPKTSIQVLTENVSEISEDIFSSIDVYKIISTTIESLDYISIYNLCNEVKNNKSINLLEVINMALLLCGKSEDPHYVELYRQNLLCAQDIADDNRQIGVFCYNLANSYRENREYYLSSHYYQQARKYEPLYLNLSYWWGEYAGVLYLSGHYKLAEKFYKKSFELDPEWNTPLIHELIGDTLFRQGNHKEALRQFAAYVDYVEDNNLKVRYEVLLKRYGCEYLISLGIEYASISNNDYVSIDEHMSLDLIKETILSNPLNPLYWFNAGIAYSIKGETRLGMYAFLICWCINENDSEALINCLLLSINLKCDMLTVSIIAVIYNRLGAGGFNLIADEFHKQPYIDEKEK